MSEGGCVLPDNRTKGSSNRGFCASAILYRAVGSDHEKIQAGVLKREETWIPPRNSAVCDAHRRLREV